MTFDRGGSFVQVARMANPLVNELIIRFGDKDRWNATDPSRKLSSSMIIATRVLPR